MKKVILVAAVLCAGVGAQAQERNVRGVLGLGLTGGGDTLATVVYTDGSTDSIKSGGPCPCSAAPSSASARR